MISLFHDNFSSGVARFSRSFLQSSELTVVIREPCFAYPGNTAGKSTGRRNVTDIPPNSRKSFTRIYSIIVSSHCREGVHLSTRHFPKQQENKSRASTFICWFLSLFLCRTIYQKFNDFNLSWNSNTTASDIIEKPYGFISWIYFLV